MADCAADSGQEVRHTLKLSIGCLSVIEQNGRLATGSEQGFKCWLTYRLSGDSQVPLFPGTYKARCLANSYSPIQIKRRNFLPLVSVCFLISQCIPP